MENFNSNDILGLRDSSADNMFRATIIHPLLDTDTTKILSARCVAFSGPDHTGPKVKGVQYGNWTRFQIDGLNNSATRNTFTLGFIDDVQGIVTKSLIKISGEQRSEDMGLMAAVDSSDLKFSVLIERFATDGVTVTDKFTYTGCLMNPLGNLDLKRDKADSGNITRSPQFVFEKIER